jgi:branched-chain amino acid transport system ATP-binding protein
MSGGAGPSGPPMRLVTRGLTVRFGGLEALAGVEVAVGAGETVGIIGPNGSGKTTLFNAISGLYRPAAGEIHLEGRPLAGLPSHAIARLGVARTFQTSRLCLGLSVFDNVLIGMHAHRRTGLWDSVVRRHRLRAEVRACLAEASRLLGLFSAGLVERGFDRVSQLPQIDRRRVEICRALALRPRLLLLDEPSAGMNPEETVELMRDLQIVRGEMPELSLVIIEHDMFVIRGVSQRVVAFNYGRKVAEGTFAEVAAHPEVREAYLGREGGRA